MRVALIGCGAVGQKRAKALPEGWWLSQVCDTEEARAVATASKHGGHVADGHCDALLKAKVAIVATMHDSLDSVAVAAIGGNIHTLVEKPGGINAAAMKELLRYEGKNSAIVRVGYNLRYHPAIRQAKQIVDSGALGPLMHIRAHYGHGGRPGMGREWRCDPAKSGGGVLMDMGSHLIDLSQWFMGRDLIVMSAACRDEFWHAEVEDNAYLHLETIAAQSASLHASWTQWKNEFRFEIYGRRGKLEINGLGGSYGVERLTHWDMGDRLGVAPPSQTWEYPGPDESWALELADFAEDIRLNRQPSCGLADAAAVLEVIERVYAQCGAREMAAA